MGDVFRKLSKPRRAQPSMGSRVSKMKVKFRLRRREKDTSEDFKLTVNQHIAANWRLPPDSGDEEVDPFAPRTTLPEPAQGSRSAATPSFIASDEQEGGRMNIQHHLLRQLFNGSNTMGIPESKLLSGMKILDAGCGSAIWLAEMNRDYPQGEYYGVDIDINPWATTFQTFARQEGRDFTLVRANLNERLPFEDNTFDFVHQQVYASVIYKDRWPLVIAEYCRILKPGGYIDLICLDSTNEFHGTPSKIHLEVNDLFQRLAEPRGADVRIARELGNLVTSNGGFVDIASMKRAAPLGWGGVAGLLWQENARRGMISLTDYACACLDITPEKWNTYITTLNQDLEKVRVVQYVYRVFARKRAVEQ